MNKIADDTNEIAKRERKWIDLLNCLPLSLGGDHPIYHSNNWGPYMI